MIERYKQLRAQAETKRAVGRWYCDRPECEGDPHEGFHWCEHPLEGPHESSCRHARHAQVPPEGDWFVWLIMAGRGWGKTRTGAEWLAREAQQHPSAHYAVIGRTTQECREVCLEGVSGLLRALDLRLDSPAYNRTTGEIRLKNGAVIHAYSAEKPESIRGANLSGAWVDEIATWRYIQVWTEGLLPALRIGRPRIAATTTPRRTTLVRDLVGRTDGSVVVVRGTTFDNEANLSPEALMELRRRYEGTRLGRQELMGELLGELEGAVFDEFRWDKHTIEGTRTLDSPFPVYRGIDFGYHHAPCLWIEVQGERCIFVFHELHAEKQTTAELAVEVLATDRELGVPEDVPAYVDPAGKGRSVQTGESDIAVLERAGISVQKADERWGPEARVEVIKELLREDRLYISREGCPYLIEAIEEAIWDTHAGIEGAPKETYKKDGKWDHHLDALGEALIRIFPPEGNVVAIESASSEGPWTPGYYSSSQFG